MSSWLGTIFCCQTQNENSKEKNSDYEEAVPFTKQENCDHQNGGSVEIPLKQGQSKFANGQNPPKIITQQPRASDSQVFFCCTSTEKSVKLREDQFDFCPQNWFQDLGNSPNSCKKFKRFLWRLSFLFTCLPLCYPCYLSRTVRRRPKHLPKQRPNRDNQFDDLNRSTLHRQVTVQSPQPNSPAKKPAVICINVIILHSSASNVLHQYFSDQNPQSIPPEQPAPAIATIAQTLISKRTMGPGVSANPNLSAVIEEDMSEANESLIQKDFVDAPISVLPPVAFPESEELSRRNAIRKKSIIGTQLSRLRRLSFQRSLSTPVNNGPSVGENGIEEKNNLMETAEDEIHLRRSKVPGGNRPQLRKRLSREVSVASTSSNASFHSCESDESDDSNEDETLRLAGTRSSKTLEMEALGQRTEDIKDLGYKVKFNLLDEATLADWKGKDLRQAKSIPNIDILILAVRKDNVAELSSVLDRHSGILGYISKFWRGFFPLLMVELEDHEQSFNEDSQESVEYAKKQNYLQSLFGEVLTISLKETQVADNMSWINECMARLFVHSRIYQCSRFFGADVMKTMTVTCPGGCGVRRHKKITWKHSRKKIARRRRSNKPLKNNRKF